jgi:hypothetical protein|tara:strand:- start:24603 stop:25499 length:897 start_codon:yes stop_codon:yes gene_type:complete
MRRDRQTKKKKSKKFKTLKCAPKQGKNVSNSLQGLSCYGDSEILNMKKIWNEKNKKQIITNNPTDIWNFLKANLSDKCYNELCWLNDKTFNSKINKDIMIKSLFRPFSPDSWKKKPYEWLSSVDIINVMSQYEKKHKDFVFLGPSPIDFDDKKLFGTCVWEKICKFDLSSQINMKKTKIGFIFNMDPHYKGGSHWMGLFVDVKKNFIFYFDSNGEKIPKRIKILVDRIIGQGNKMNINLKFMSNAGKVHQRKDGQCGMFAIYFIIELLKGTKTPEYFKNHRIPDEEMRDYRQIYYNTH